VGSAVEAVPAEEGDEAAEAQPRRGRTSAAPPPLPRRRRRRHRRGAKKKKRERQRGTKESYYSCQYIVGRAFPSNMLGRNRIRARLILAP